MDAQSLSVEVTPGCTLMSSQAVAEKLVVPSAQTSMSLPLRNLFLTFLLTLTVIAIVGSVWGTTGYEMLIVSMGWPHVILGFLFYFGKVLRGEWRARSSFLLLALVTLALWVTHYTYTITGFIAVYFTYHVFRDEVFIYFQTRARHRLRDAVYVAGFVPFILLMFVATDPRPQHYRQDLRRVEMTGAQLSPDGWTLISFGPIPYSKGREFYFYLQTPNADGGQAYTTLATTGDTRADGEIRISDRKWADASDLVFRLHYAADQDARPDELPISDRTIPVALTGGHRVGQTFTAQRDNLAGLWIPTQRAADAGGTARYMFHLTTDTSLPLPPLSPVLKGLRLALVAILLLVVLWKALPQLNQNRSFWIYFALFLAIFALLQKVIKAGAGSGYEFPIMFQLVVVFHYWSWYVFSFDKLLAMSRAPASTSERAQNAGGTPQVTLYDRMMGSLRSLPRFTALAIALNLISLAGVLWYSRFHGPATLRYGFDYSYFLYFLVFHVTFSFAPKQALPRTNAPSASLPAAGMAPAA